MYCICGTELSNRRVHTVRFVFYLEYFYARKYFAHVWANEDRIRDICYCCCWKFMYCAVTMCVLTPDLQSEKKTRIKVKGKGLDTCYSATYMSQTRDQQRFTISEVAADWHEPVVPQRIMWPSLPVLTDNWTHGAASRHTIAPISHTRPSPHSRSYYSFPVPLREGGWVGLSTQ